MSVTQASLLGDTFGSKASGTIPVGGIIMWSGSTASIPTGWALCNGANGTPNLLDKFIVGAGSGYGVGATGGANSVTLNIDQIPSHTHIIGGDGAHNHQMFVSQVNDRELNAANQAVARVGNGGYDDSRKDYGMARSDNPTTDTPNVGRTSSVGNHDHGGATGSRGGNQAHENRPPYYALAFIMRVS